MNDPVFNEKHVDRIVFGTIGVIIVFAISSIGSLLLLAYVARAVLKFFGIIQ